MKTIFDTLPQAQAGAKQSVTKDIMWIIIGKRTMWLLIAKLRMHIVFDTLHPLRQGAHTKVTRHMNKLLGMRRIFINMFHLHRQGYYIPAPRHMFHLHGTPRIFTDTLHRLGAMPRVHMHMSLHQGTLRSVIDILHRGIIIAIAHLMIVIAIASLMIFTAMVHRMIFTAIEHLMNVIDTAMMIPQGVQLHKRQGRHHMRRLPMIHQDPRWCQVLIKRTLIT
jgi:hypothetical protein